jgi:hypothetical protein
MHHRLTTRSLLDINSWSPVEDALKVHGVSARLSKVPALVSCNFLLPMSVTS